MSREKLDKCEELIRRHNQGGIYCYNALGGKYRRADSGNDGAEEYAESRAFPDLQRKLTHIITIMSIMNTMKALRPRA